MMVVRHPIVAGMLAFVICTIVWAGTFIAHFYRRQ
jgi:protein-S-isoprenylcysteine O-methyltransferase Ste14